VLPNHKGATGEIKLGEKDLCTTKGVSSHRHNVAERGGGACYKLSPEDNPRERESHESKQTEEKA